MKRLIILLALLVLPLSLSADMNPYIAGSVEAAGRWYYGDGAESDPYSINSGGLNNTFRRMDIWCPGVTKSITKIGCKIASLTTTDEITLGLWEYVSGTTWTLRRCVTISDPSTGWNDADITSFALTSGMTIAVSYIANQATEGYRTEVQSGGFVQGLTYADECDATTMSPITYYSYGVRFWGE